MNFDRRTVLVSPGECAYWKKRGVIISSINPSHGYA